MARRRFSIASIEQLQRTLENTPARRVEEVTKVEAIRMLSPQIHAMRSKGYGLGAIAGVLSENDIAVTAVTLKGYLKKFKSSGGTKPTRKRGHRRGPGDSQRDAPVNLSAPIEGACHEVSPSSPKSGRGGSTGPNKGAPVGASSASTSAVGTTSEESSRAGKEGAPCRSAFVPKEDTRDI